MRKDITIGQETVEVVANAATPFVYLKVFGEDLLNSMQKNPEDILRLERLTFVMKIQAEYPTSELMAGGVTQDDFFEWLEGFEQMDMIDGANAAVSVYLSSKKGKSVPKTKAD